MEYFETEADALSEYYDEYPQLTLYTSNSKGVPGTQPDESSPFTPNMDLEYWHFYINTLF